MRTPSENIQLLRALCQTEDVSTRRRACEVLENYAWAEGEHRVIFEACAALTHFGIRISRGSLATQVTRAGFPDVDLDTLFDPLPTAPQELARRLAAQQEQES